MASGVNLIDYGPARGRSVLLGSGTGLMMAIMDQVPEFRWCADLDLGGHALDFAILAAPNVRALGLAGWFSITSPAAFVAVAGAELGCKVLTYGGNVRLGCATLDDFLAAAKHLAAPRIPWRRKASPP